MTIPDRRFSWRYRRLCVFGALALCAFEIVYLTIVGTDTTLNVAIAGGAFALASAVIGSYVFGAAYHDRNLMQNNCPPPIDGASNGVD